MPQEEVSLLLEDQLCFPFYAISRLITQQYAPFLKQLNITYPQYLVLMLLWEHEELSVGEISQRLYLESNTLTPLLKRMEAKGLLTRTRSQEDERKVLISITSTGSALKSEAECIPQSLFQTFDNDQSSAKEFHLLRKTLQQIIQTLDTSVA
ncbi:MarR family winged helix-turn-helix transcriptional regulator [Jiulongibacter sp. NS-SX5]|uniref:MarR family winged helix-turn-helix transcriptional regulator n=1 Tax=Jiulongibacter sp. NS-SX5 TaxID=3463854 RepID=UPI004057D1AC